MAFSSLPANHQSTPKCFTALCFQVACKDDVINCLLDHGADVNHLTDEGVSSLSACFVLLCPPSTFAVNFVDPDRPLPTDFQREPNYVPPAAVANSNKQAAATGGKKSGADGQPVDKDHQQRTAAAATNQRMSETKLSFVSKEPTESDCNAQLDGSLASEGCCDCPRMIGQLCVRRSPKVDVEAALLVGTNPELFFDETGNMIVVQQENNSLSTSSQLTSQTTEAEVVCSANDGHAGVKTVAEATAAAPPATETSAPAAAADLSPSKVLMIKETEEVKYEQ